ncbi:MAG: hypothetical protein L0H84_12535 [Pseudonocardia sp.]|nr:hypothetical protein [Pseudonocardia sp.]
MTAPAPRSRHALRAVARAQRRVRGLFLLAALAGTVGAMVAGAAALAERSATAYPRLVAQVGLDDARVLVPADQPELAGAVPRMPGVVHAWTTSAWVARVAGRSVAYISLGAGTDRPADLVRPVVVAGRAPDPAVVDEVLVGEPVAERHGVRVGDELRLELLTLPQIALFDVGFGNPDGPAVTLRVVGVGRMPAWGGALSNAWASDAFARTSASTAAAHAVFARPAGPAGAAACADAYLAAAGAAPPSVAARHLPPEVALPTSEVDPSIEAAEGAIVIGLAVLALVVAGGGALVVGQGLVRRHAAGRAAQQVELALGMTAGERVAARVLAAVPAAGLATAIALAGGVAAGLLEPLGSQARFEPTPGFRMPWPVLLTVGPVTALLFLGGVALAAAAAGRRRTPANATRRPVPLAWARRRAALLVGIRLAMPGGRGRPAMLTVGASVAATAGVVAAAVFGASLERLVTEPARYGAVADFSVVDARLGDIERLVADPRTTAVTVIRTSSVQLTGGHAVPAVVAFAYKGPIGITVARGSLPTRTGQIAIGPRLAGTTGTQVGDTVSVDRPGGGAALLTVTGIVVTPQSDQRHRLGEGVVLAGEQAATVTAAPAVFSAEVSALPEHLAGLMAELGDRLEVEPRQVPAEIRTLVDLRSLPEFLAAALGLLVVAAAVYELTSARRRHAREIAVLTVVGETPAQVRATLAVLAVVTVGPGLALGVPVGIGIARVLWWQVATATGVGPDVVVPAVVLAMVPAVLLVALAAAVGPVLRGTSTGRVLRSGR